jgi:hypothetical protein
MAGVQRFDFDSPDETRTPEKTREDGTEAEVGPGDAYVIEPGHEAEGNGRRRGFAPLRAGLLILLRIGRLIRGGSERAD